MLVYRIETIHGSGPFYSGLMRAVSELAEARQELNGRWFRYHDVWSMPCQGEMRERDTSLHGAFLGRKRTSFLYFGFASKRQLVNWFRSRKFRRLMFECGLGLAIYEVDAEYVYEGNYQVAFNRSAARKIASYFHENAAANAAKISKRRA